MKADTFFCNYSQFWNNYLKIYPAECFYVWDIQLINVRLNVTWSRIDFLLVTNTAPFSHRLWSWTANDTQSKVHAEFQQCIYRFVKAFTIPLNTNTVLYLNVWLFFVVFLRWLEVGLLLAKLLSSTFQNLKHA